MTSQVKLLINTRKYTRKLVTECHNKRLTFSNLSDVEKDQIRVQLQDHLNELKKLNSDIQTQKWAEEENENWLNDEFKVCESYFVKIRECNALLKTNATPSEVPLDTARSLLKSPTAPLPQFKSQEGEDLLRFFKEFEDITSMFKYSEYDRFILLKQQVSGRASILLSSLESDKQGYLHAKNLLTQALATEDIQTFNVIKQLSEMKMDYDSDPFEYISKMRTLTETVQTLNLDADSFLRYFFWQGLNESFKTHLTQITNFSKPTLQQINDKFFEAAERYQVSQNSRKRKFNVRTSNVEVKNPQSNVEPKNSQSKSLVFAANVNYNRDNYKPCSICSSLDNKPSLHPIYKCDKYKDAKSKISKLKSLKGCIKCGNLSHTKDYCKFKFNSKCRNCKAWHFTFLCDEDKKPSNVNSSPSTNHETNSKLAITDVLKINLDNEQSILPTFSCKIKDRSIRCLKDGGCQSNFITENFADSLSLKVLKDKVELKINGINVSQKYFSKVVELEICFGNEN